MIDANFHLTARDLACIFLIVGNQIASRNLLLVLALLLVELPSCKGTSSFLHRIHQHKHKRDGEDEIRTGQVRRRRTMSLLILGSPLAETESEDSRQRTSLTLDKDSNALFYPWSECTDFDFSDIDESIFGTLHIGDLQTLELFLQLAYQWGYTWTLY